MLSPRSSTRRSLHFTSQKFVSFLTNIVLGDVFGNYCVFFFFWKFRVFLAFIWNDLTDKIILEIERKILSLYYQLL